MSGQKPLAQRDMASLEDRAGPNRELLSAIVTKEHASLSFACHFVNVQRSAMRAIRTIRPTVSFHMGRGLGLVGKNRVVEIACHGVSSYDRYDTPDFLISQGDSCRNSRLRS